MKARAIRNTGVALLLTAVGVGCVQGQDAYWHVEDLRVLAIRAEPPEIMDSQLPEDIRFEALVADPQAAGDEAITLEWEFCPVASGRACLDYEDQLAAAQGGIAPLAEGIGFTGNDDAGGGGDGAGGGGGGGTSPWGDCPLSLESIFGFATLGQAMSDLMEPGYLTERYRGPLVGETFALTTSTFSVGVEEPAVPVAEDGPQMRRLDLSFLSTLVAELRACDPMAVPADLDPASLPEDISDLQLFHFFSNPVGAMLGVAPSVILTATSGDQVLRAQKRINLAFRHPAAPLSLFRLFAPGLDFGLPFCVPGEPPSPGCISVRERVPNSNPVFADIRMGMGDDARTRFESIRIPGYDPARPDAPPVFETIQVEAGEAIRILPVFTPDSYEPFESIGIDLETQQVQTTESEEQISVSWFVTDGRIHDQITHPVLTKGLDTAYTAADEPPAATGGVVRMWLVARDQRGGIAWQELTIVVLAP